MPSLSATPRFVRAYKKLPPGVQQAVDEALRRFMENPRHPALHFEKLSGSKYRTIRVDRGTWRIVLRGTGGEFDLVDVDIHKTVDAKYG
jgi:mRNA-degrading endonuclease RelE of RelBE toxin-antitoxin system